MDVFHKVDESQLTGSESSKEKHSYLHWQHYNGSDRISIGCRLSLIDFAPFLYRLLFYYQTIYK